MTPPDPWPDPSIPDVEWVYINGRWHAFPTEPPADTTPTR